MSRGPALSVGQVAALPGARRGPERASHPKPNAADPRNEARRLPIVNRWLQNPDFSFVRTLG